MRTHKILKTAHDPDFYFIYPGLLIPVTSIRMAGRPISPAGFPSADTSAIVPFHLFSFYPVPAFRLFNGELFDISNTP